MNTKLSGARLVLVPITREGKNYLPFIEYLDHRLIKYIDFAPAAYLPDTDAPGLTTSADLFVTIMNEPGTTELHKNLPLERLDYQQTIGIRQPIFNKINLSASYIDCQDPSAVGKTAALLFWYDLPEYSQRNMTTALTLDAFSVPVERIDRYNPFPDIDRMTNKRFRRLLLGTPTATPDMKPGVLPTDLQNVYVTLQKGAYRILDNCPVMLLYQIAMLEKTEFQNIIFDFESSYITIGGNGTYPTPSDYVGKSVFFNAQYES